MSEDEAFASVVHMLLDKNTTAGVRDILHAYGDTRERAGLERAKEACGAARRERTVDTMFNKGFDLGTQVCAALIDELSVPAPDAGGAKEQKNATCD